MNGQTIIRSLQTKDFASMKEWMVDPETNLFFRERFNEYSDEQILAFIKNSESDRNIHKAIVDEFDEYLGTISLKNIDNINSNAEYAIMLRKNARGTNIGNTATTKILDLAFKTLNLNKVYLNVLNDNEQAIKFYEKYGFRLEGQFVKHILHQNEFKDLKWYSITREEFLEREHVK